MHGLEFSLAPILNRRAEVKECTPLFEVNANELGLPRVAHYFDGKIAATVRHF